MTIRIEGLDGPQRKLRKIPAQIEKEVSVALNEGAERIADGARARVSVDSGSLRNSIHVRQSEEGMSASVETSAEHARHVEFGTRHAPARPFLLPAFDEAKPKVVAEVRGAVRRALKDGAKG